MAAPVREPALPLDDDDARHHVLAGGPADAPLDVDLRAVDEAAGRVAEAALERDLAALQDADADRVLGTPEFCMVTFGDAGARRAGAQLEVDLARARP
jgi:hypothetical protein